MSKKNTVVATVPAAAAKPNLTALGAAAFSPNKYHAALLVESAQYEPGSPEAHVLPVAVGNLLRETDNMTAKWQLFASQLVDNGARSAMFPLGAQYGTPKSTPEKNLLFSTIATALCSKDEARLVLLTREEAKDLPEESKERRQKLQALVGKKANMVYNHILTMEVERGLVAKDAPDRDGKGKGPKGARAGKAPAKSEKLTKANVTAWALGQVQAIIKAIEGLKDAPAEALELKALLVDVLDDVKA